MKALVIQKGGIGDVVFGLPLLRDLKHGLPAVELTVLTHAAGAQVLEHCPDVDTVLTFGASDLRQVLRAARFDVAASTTRSFSVAWLLYRSGIPVRAGFGGGPERLLYTNVAPVRPFEVQFAKRFQRLARALGVETKDTPGRLLVTDTAKERARAQLLAGGWDGRRALVAVHVGGGWPSKRWPVEHIRTLIETISPAQVVLQGGAEDGVRAQQLVGLGAIDTTHDSISDAIAKAPFYSASVGLDSGLSHAMAACGVPTVFLFGPNDPSSIRLADSQQMLLRELACRPCNRRARSGCPEGHHRCMREHTPLDVITAIARLTYSPARLRRGQ